MDVANMPKVVPMEEREWFVLFSICVAGKSAKQTEKKLNELLSNAYSQVPEFYQNTRHPFDALWYLDNNDKLEPLLHEHKIGQYRRILKAFRGVIATGFCAYNDLTVEKLEAIPGIGPKTARFIVLYTDPNAECAVLDTHILKYLKMMYPAFNIPKSTPSGKKYKEIEELFQYTAKRLGKTVRQLDTEIWQYYSSKGTNGNISTETSMDELQTITKGPI